MNESKKDTVFVDSCFLAAIISTFFSAGFKDGLSFSFTITFLLQSFLVLIFGLIMLKVSNSHIYKNSFNPVKLSRSMTCSDIEKAFIDFESFKNREYVKLSKKEKLIMSINTILYIIISLGIRID